MSMQQRCEIHLWVTSAVDIVAKLFREKLCYADPE